MTRKDYNMPKPINAIGMRIGMLEVVERAENTKQGATRWICKCDCGNLITLTQAQIKKKTKDNCGCVKKKHFNATHGCSETRLYYAWSLMISRCERPKNRAYKYYGQRGITVCDEWHDFLNFKAWVDATKPEGEYTLDRIDNNKGYSPDNCRWADKKTQANNRRSNVEIEYNGETHNLSEWSELLGFDYKRVHNRIHKLGWTFEKAISTPVDKKKRNKVERGKNV